MKFEGHDLSDNSIVNTDRFIAALSLIDEANAQDPNRVDVKGESIGYELYFSQQLVSWVLKLRENASEELLLASRSQHIRRWESPRKDYPEGRAGYLKWRADLKKFHAEKTAEILEKCGYEKEAIDRVSSLNLKKDLRKDEECQTLEDALCLVFLEKQFAKFRQKTDRETMVGILRKTWGKMSADGHAAALGLAMGEEELELVKEALA
ncbi:DUF4202 domain-containing protein [Puniceicoccaceae bacterium K14]|nr:DUF4202 domain-containing protein [Puniceicoccaceae bacterium K14]